MVNASQRAFPALNPSGCLLAVAVVSVNAAALCPVVDVDETRY